MCPHSIKTFLPCFYPWHHAREKRYQALHILRATKNGMGLGTRLLQKFQFQHNSVLNIDCNSLRNIIKTTLESKPSCKKLLAVYVEAMFFRTPDPFCRSAKIVAYFSPAIVWPTCSKKAVIVGCGVLFRLICSAGYSKVFTHCSICLYMWDDFLAELFTKQVCSMLEWGRSGICY